MATRSYRQGARAEAAEESRQRIVDVMAGLLRERDFIDITLDEIADGAGVTLQTVLRKFGSKDALFAATIEEHSVRVMSERMPVAPGPRAAVVALVASYEDIGEANWRMLRHEHLQPALQRVLAHARTLHRAWVEASFADVLPPRGAARGRMLELLATALDFYVWKLHRRDLGRTRAETEAVMLELVEAVVNRRRT